MRFLKNILTIFNSKKTEIKEVSLKISPALEEFVKSEMLPGLDISENYFWSSFENLLNKFYQRNEDLLDIRKQLQVKIDNWHLERNKRDIDIEEYKDFLEEIGYLHPRSKDFQISTWNVDPEIRKIAGPQLVVPVMNARFALNAANARWGSLYDALYGTDVISESDGAEKVGSYNPVRGDKVIDFAKNFLDETIPLAEGSYKDVLGFEFVDGNIQAVLPDSLKVQLKNPAQYIGYRDDSNDAYSLLFKNNNLHFEIQIDSNHPIGQTDKAGIKDILMESAITTIQDCEDSVAAVDGEDKTAVYRNWLGLMKGDLEESFTKNDSVMTRKLNPDRNYISKEGHEITLPGRSLMLVRNVGHLMTNPGVLDAQGNEVPEGIIDAMFTICIAMHDLNKNGLYQNSKTGSVYIVKPKMHGPEEVAFTNTLFEKVEETLGIKKYSIKVGIMDEERRTTVNLKECIRQVKNRIVFINTGFLDRTGDEMHTSFEAGPMIFKGEMKKSTWLNTYENWNVDIGLKCGFSGKAQIGKGMWAMPDQMANMMEQKIGHPKSGANCAWVPSPTAATLHSLHYHKVNVFDEQDKIKSREIAKVENILEIPKADRPNWSVEDINREIENNAQGILGYVVRWVDQGVGCSKVPDINNVGLMEDRATLRISSQHIANWLHHGICNKEQVMKIMKKMAKTVDDQNKNDPKYKKMSEDFEKSIAFSAACDLVFKGRVQPSGYTEPLLHQKRLEKKSTN